MLRASLVPMLLALACNGRVVEATPPKPAELPPPAAAAAPAPRGPEIHALHLREHVEHLASDEMAGRPTPSPQLDAAAGYIAKQFASIGLQSPQGVSEFRQTFSCGHGESPSANVIAVLPGRAKPTVDAIIVSAHYDHVGIRAPQDDKDSIYNGANDNASGVAALVEIARFLSVRGDPLPRAVVFIAFCGEELGLRGSRHYASAPVWPLEHTVAVVNLEMLGRPERRDPPRAWITGMDLSDLSETFASATTSELVEFVASKEIGPLEADTFRRSDNYPFAQAGVVAHTIAAGRLDELYHSADDEADTIDFDRMAKIVQGIALGVESLARTDVHPDWTKAGRAQGLGR